MAQTREFAVLPIKLEKNIIWAWLMIHRNVIGGVVEMQDSQSHRIIEKRRRDRINNCLADLGRLVTNDCVRHGHGQCQARTKQTSQGRVKKTEIIEMAIQRIRQLQSELSGL